MTAEVAEQLEDIRIELEVAALSEAEFLPYLQTALEMWGIAHTSTDLDGLMAEAIVALENYELTEAARRGRDGRFIKGSAARTSARRSYPSAYKPRTAPTQSDRTRQGRKMTGSLAQRLGHWVGTALVRTAAYAAGKVAQGTGHLLSKAKGQKAAALGRKLKGGSKNFIKKVMDL